MKTFWIVFLVAFLVFIIVNAIRGRHYSNAVYRARFRSRMPHRKSGEAANDATFVAVPLLLGVTTDSAHHSPPDCASHAGSVDGGGGCGDGGGSAS